MTMYMNIATGSVDSYEGWWYTDEDGVKKNAVDDGDVVEVVWNKETESWDAI